MEQQYIRVQADIAAIPQFLSHSAMDGDIRHSAGVTLTIAGTGPTGTTLTIITARGHILTTHLIMVTTHTMDITVTGQVTTMVTGMATTVTDMAEDTIPHTTRKAGETVIMDREETVQEVRMAAASPGAPAGQV